MASTAPMNPNEREALRRSALEHLWVFMQDPAEMAEKGGPTLAVEGRGVWVRDAEGREYLDGMSGLWLVNVGYGREEIAEVAREQMRALPYAPFGTTTEPTVRLAERLARLAPTGPGTRVFFANSGSEAVEMAVKIARAYHRRRGEAGRYKVISRKGSYHGATGLAMWLGGTPPYTRQDYEPAYPGMLYAPQPNPYRCEMGGRTPSECARLCAQAVEDLIRFHGPETVCAFVGEPIASPPGAAVPGDEYWPRIREICDKYGVLLIVDEVICGFGRTGRWFGIEHWGIRPDLVTTAKGITSGYLPMGAVFARKEVADAFIGGERAMFRHIYTFGGHPVASAVALKNLEILEREDLVGNARRMGDYLLDRMRDLQARHPIVGDVRGKGLLIGVELVRDRATKEPFPPEARLPQLLAAKFRQHGVLLRPTQTIQLAPPLCITRGECDLLAEAVDRVLTEVEQEMGLAPGGR